MNCVNCGKMLKPGKPFCTGCGTKNAIAPAAQPAPSAPPVNTDKKICHSCGKTLKPNIRFCNGCGKPVPVAQATQSASVAPSVLHETPSVEFGVPSDEFDIPSTEFNVTSTPVTLPVYTDKKVCSSCGKMLKPNMRFCNGCGKPVTVVPVSPSAAPTPPAVEIPSSPFEFPASSAPTNPIYNVAFPSIDAPAHPGPQPAPPKPVQSKPRRKPRTAADGMGCYHHPSQQALAQCAGCGNAICADCREMYGVTSGDYAGKALCYDCTTMLVAENIKEVEKIKKKTQIMTLLSLFIVTPLKLLWDMVKGGSMAASGNLSGAFVMVITMFKFCVFPFVAIYRIVVLWNQSKQAKEIMASDARALQEMRDYFAYTQTMESNEGVDLASLAAQGGVLFDNTYAKNVIEQGEQAAQAQLRRSVVTISENGEILRSFEDKPRDRSRVA